MSDNPQEFLAKFNSTAHEAAIFLFITRDMDLQRAACSKLGEMLALLAAEKKGAVAAQNEDYANALLACEFVAHGLIAHIRMWLLLKEAKPDQAWDQLITAQDSLRCATKAHDGLAHLEGWIRRLEAIEELVFPPQVFLSSGMIVESQICSICGQEYEDCPHVKGRPYMGKFCTVRLIPSKLDHVSIVENPADKRCRIVKFSAEGGYRNRMTWRLELPESDTAGLTTDAIVATSRALAE